MGKTYNVNRVPTLLAFMRSNPDVIFTSGLIARVLDVEIEVARAVLQNVYHNQQHNLALYRIGCGEYSLHKPEHAYTSRADQIERFIRERGMASTDELVELTSLPPNVVQTVVQRMQKSGKCNVKSKYYYVLQEEVADV